MSKDVLSGFDIRMLCESEPVKVVYVANKKEVTSQSGIRFQKDEHILKMVMDYDDKAIRGIRLSTDQQLISLGPSYESDFFVECDKTDTDNAIIGFQFVFGDDRIVEVSVFSAPLAKKVETLQRSSKTIAFERLNTHLLTHLKSIKKNEEDGGEDNLKATFKLYRKLKKNNSY